MMIPRGRARQALKAGQQRFGALALAVFALLAACAPFPLPTPGPESTVAATPWPYTITDENAVVAGICFESAYDAARRVFVLRSDEELAWLFDSSDQSGLCRRPSPRGSFDFSGGRVLVGTWSRGLGCTADHLVRQVSVEDAARVVTIVAQFVTEGDCPYELVRPFWMSVAGYNGYDIRLTIMP